jgi:hypothetical protein
MRSAYGLICLAAVAAWFGALVAGASFAHDLAYACAGLGVGAFALQLLDRRRRAAGGVGSTQPPRSGAAGSAGGGAD